MKINSNKLNHKKRKMKLNSKMRVFNNNNNSNNNKKIKNRVK